MDIDGGGLREQVDMVVCGSLRWQGVMWVEQEMELREEVEDGGRKVLSGFYFLRDDGYMAI